MIKLRRVEQSDLKFINDIRNDISTRSQLEYNDVISLDETISWFNNYRPLWYIVSYESIQVGYIRTSHDTGKSICIGCDIDKNYRGNGYAKNALIGLIAELKLRGYSVIWLNAYKDNTIACTIYKKIGFVEVGSAPRIVNNREYITMVFC